MHLTLSASAYAQVDGGGPVALAPRDAALLAWLALEGPTPRARLAALLWPDSDADDARNALRQRLFQLRKLLGTDAVSGTTALALAEGITHDLLESDLVLGEGAPVVNGEFAAWLGQQRQRRHDRVRQALAEFAQTAEAAGDWHDALSHARELLALEPLSEEAHRRLMRLHYLAGDRAAALLAFDRCEQVLKDEVGARPSAETLALLTTIEAGAAAPLAVGAALPASVLRPPRLIGRERELAALMQGWQAGQVVALIGEAGLGKTRLLQTFIDSRRGVVRAAGRPGDAGVPFATLARLLRAVLALGGDEPGSALAIPSRGEISRVLPELDGGGARPAGEGQRLVLQRALRDLLASRPQLGGLILDDLHFADEASVEMIGALIDGEEGAENDAAGLRWALAYRPAEAGSPVQALHDGLVEQARLAPLPLAPLDVSDLAALVDSLSLPGVDGAALAPGLLRRTGGNPMFVLETLKQAWVDRKLAQLADARLLPRPVGVGRLIERRVMQLSPGALALARVASIAGVDFGIAMAEQVLGASAMQFADALNELEAAQVLRGTQFAHDLIFEAVHDSVPAAIALHTHGRVAEYLEQRGGEPARIAAHWISANQRRQALPWLKQAADAAGAALRTKEQIAFLEQKSAIEEASGDRIAAFASQLRAAEQQVTVDGEGEHGLHQCDRLDALAANPTDTVRARIQRAHLASMRGELAASEAVARDALQLAQRSDVEPRLAVECRHHLATALALQDRTAEALPHFEAAMIWIDEHGNDDLRCELHGNLANAYDSLGRIVDSVRHHERALALAQQFAHHGNYTMCLNNYAANRILGGRLRDGEALLVRARQALAQAEDASSHAGFIAMLQSICDYQSGRYRVALRAIAASEDALAHFAPGFRRTALTHLAVCWTHLGQWSRLEQLLKELGDPLQLPFTTRLRLTVLRHQMDLALGRRVTPLALQAVIADAGQGDTPDMRHMVQLEIAMLAEPVEGLRQLGILIEEATTLGHEGTRISAQARAARRAADAGQAAVARQLAASALEGARSFDLVRQYRAEIWLHCGAAQQIVGDTQEARETVAQGWAWVQAIARDEVPEEFREGFLQRNPVNYQLQAMAARLLHR